MIHSVVPSASAAPAPAPASTPAPAPAPTDKAPEPTASAAPASAEPTTEAKEVNTDLDAGQVKAWSGQQKAIREAKAEIARLQKERDDFKTKAESPAQKIADLKAARAAGIDIEQLFSEWTSEGLEAPPPKEVVEIRAELDAIKAAREAEEAKTKTADEERLTAERKRADEGVTGFVTETLAKDKATDSPKWPLCAREPEAVADAKAITLDAVKKLVKAEGRDITPEEADVFLAAAFDALETHYRTLGERYRLDEVPPRAGNSRGTSRVREPVASRPSATIDNNRGSLHKPTQAARPYKTFREVKAEVLAKRAAR